MTDALMAEGAALFDSTFAKISRENRLRSMTAILLASPCFVFESAGEMRRMQEAYKLAEKLDAALAWSRDA